MSIERRDAASLSLAEFCESYMLANRPVIITGAMGRWRATKEWVTATGRPDAAFLKAQFGKAQITAHNCKRVVMGGLRTKEMTVGEYMDWWNEHVECSKRDGGEQFYLKDWNFCKQFPHYLAYETPSYFEHDWLNDHEATDREDHRFVYLGPKNSFTPLHKDVLQSFSWSANVCGSKEWLFLSPQYQPYLYNHNCKLCGKELCTDSPLPPRQHIFDLRDVDETKFQNFHLAKDHIVPVTQGPGEIIFVPSGWWHQVRNLEDTLSINHNWFNAANVRWGWNLLQFEAEVIRRSVPDCEWDEPTAQGVLELKFDWNYQIFFNFLCGVLSRELRSVVGTMKQAESLRMSGQRDKRSSRSSSSDKTSSINSSSSSSNYSSSSKSGSCSGGGDGGGNSSSSSSGSGSSIEEMLCRVRLHQLSLQRSARLLIVVSNTIAAGPGGNCTSSSEGPSAVDSSVEKGSASEDEEDFDETLPPHALQPYTATPFPRCFRQAAPQLRRLKQLEKQLKKQLDQHFLAAATNSAPSMSQDRQAMRKRKRR